MFKADVQPQYFSIGSLEQVDFGTIPDMGNCNPANEITIPKLHLTSRVSLAVVQIYGRNCKMFIMCVWNSKCEGNLNKCLRDDAYRESATKGKERLIQSDQVFEGKKGQAVGGSQAGCDVTMYSTCDVLVFASCESEE